MNNFLVNLGDRYFSFVLNLVSSFLIIAFIITAFFGQALLAQTLEQKVQFHHQKLKEAQEKFKSYYQSSSAPLSAVQVERWLEIESNFKINSSDLIQIKNQQNQVVQSTSEKLKNLESNSPIQLDKIREKNLAKPLCEAIPKGGMLHIHPWGTVDRPTLIKILDAVSPKIVLADIQALLDQSATSSINPEFFKAFETSLGGPTAPQSIQYIQLNATQRQKFQDLFFLPQTPSPFNQFLGPFSLIVKYFWSKPGYDPSPLMWEGFFKRAQKNKIFYVEASLTVPRKASAFQKHLEWAEQIKSTYGIVVKSLHAFDRTKSATENLTTLFELFKLPANQTFIGINLVSDEGAHPALEAQNLYGAISKNCGEGNTCLRRTIHAGELGEKNNVRDAIIMGSERIGHGVKIEDDALLLDFMAQNKVPIEINILSNYRLGVVKNIKDHPFRKYLRLGIPLNLSTDDEGIFETDLSQECEAVVTNSDITYPELVSVLENSLKYSFAPQTQKEALLLQFKSAITDFEKAWVATH